MTQTEVPRLPALDLVRGVAVLGILAINVAGFAGPPAAAYSPSPAHLASAADRAVFAIALLLFEGKMRCLFALLFGAGMELYVTRADARGEDGGDLQARRLLWLAVFGYLHFALLWWGDILFTYAAAGYCALLLRRLPDRALLAGALLLFASWQITGARGELPAALAEAHIAAGAASSADTAMVRRARAEQDDAIAYYTAATRQGFAAQVAGKLSDQAAAPFGAALFELGEVLPYMLLGTVLLRMGLFSGEWPRARLTRLAIATLVPGAGATLAFVVWAWRHAYPLAAMRLAIDHALGFPHLGMAVGYAALLVRFAPALLATRPGERLAAAGRMALSNYIGCTLVMTAIFYGWGLGLGGQVGAAAQAGFVLLGWALMLAASAPWLTRFRQGPLEWLWRSLVRGKPLPLRR